MQVVAEFPATAGKVQQVLERNGELVVICDHAVYKVDPFASRKQSHVGVSDIGEGRRTA